MGGYLPAYPRDPVRIASCRDFNTNLKDSVKIVCEKYIREMGLESEFDVYAHWITHKRGSYMGFHGVTRNPDSFLSMEDIDVFWMEQAEVVGEEMLKIEPTIRKPGSELWFVWNPDQRSQYCWQRFVLTPEAGDISMLVNWRDNPWWFPRCGKCQRQCDWEERQGECPACGGPVSAGLWELELLRRRTKKYEPSLYPWMWEGQPNDGDATRQVLPYAVLNQCVEAYRAGLAPPRGNLPCHMGLDIAEGGRDQCAQVIRIGPSIEFVEQWPGIVGDLSQAASRCHANTEGWGVEWLYYDASSPMATEFERLEVPYVIASVHFGGEVGGKEVFYEPDRRNQDIFRARNIQMADNLRLRANRTVRLLNGDENIDPNACLFINPDIPEREAYLADLSQPIRRRSPLSGKWELDKRGGDEKAESPDRFDGTCLAFAYDSEFGLTADGEVY